jgi:peptidoglycan glycosyltransferase
MFIRFRRHQKTSRWLASALYALCLPTQNLFAAEPPSQLNAAPEMLLEDQVMARSLQGVDPEELAFNRRSPIRGRVAPSNQLEVVDVQTRSDGVVQLRRRPDFSKSAVLGERFASQTPRGHIVFYTLQPSLQNFVRSAVERAGAQHIAVVVMEPTSGAILALAGKSPTIPDIEYHSGFFAASLFKVVTAAAAKEVANVDHNTTIAFRGGTYSLTPWNYLPNSRLDRRTMTVGDALGKSCNPVFGQLGIKYLNGQVLARYANKFGFNAPMGFDAPLPSSTADIPHQDLFELSRTAAGFGEVRMSPIHGAALASAIGSGGLLPQPHLIHSIVDRDGVSVIEPRQLVLQQSIQPQTAASVLEMMRRTTAPGGTSARYFNRGNQSIFPNYIYVAGKTGTLTADNPRGLSNLFIGVAGRGNYGTERFSAPDLAVAVFSVNVSSVSGKPSFIARNIMAHHYGVTLPSMPDRPVVRHPRSKSKVRRGSPAKYSSKKKGTYRSKPSKNSGKSSAKKR